MVYLTATLREIIVLVYTTQMPESQLQIPVVISVNGQN